MGFLKRSKRKKMGDTSSHIALGPVLLLAQFFAVMPLYGITARSANNLKFTYFNLRTFHTVIIITGNMVMVILSILWAASNQLTISVFGNHFLIDVWIDYRKESKFTSKWFCFQFAIARLLWSRKMLNDFFITFFFLCRADCMVFNEMRNINVFLVVGEKVASVNEWLGANRTKFTNLPWTQAELRIFQ